jgi:hypothetical protein
MFKLLNINKYYRDKKQYSKKINHYNFIDLNYFYISSYFDISLIP